MKSYVKLKAEIESIQQLMVEAKKNERANALKDVKRLRKEFGFTAGITLLDLDESAVSTLNSIRNIEALLLDEEVAAKLKQSSTADETLSFKSLDDVDEREQYEHLSQLLHIQKATRDKR